MVSTLSVFIGHLEKISEEGRGSSNVQGLKATLHYIWLYFARWHSFSHESIMLRKDVQYWCPAARWLRSCAEKCGNSGVHDVMIIMITIQSRVIHWPAPVQYPVWSLATFQVSITGGHRDLGPGLLLGFSHTLRHRSLTEDWSSKQIVLQNLLQISKRPVREEIHTGLMEEIRNHHYHL